MLEQLAGGVAEVLRDVDLLGRAARPRGRHVGAVVGSATAEPAVAEEVREELVEEAPATERRPPYAATLTLKLPQVLFADGDRPLLTVLPDPHGCDGGPTPVDLAHRGRHQILLAAGTPAREGLVHGGTRLVENASPEVCSVLQPPKQSAASPA